MRFVVSITPLVVCSFMLSGCLSTKSSWTHYDECSAQTTTFVAMAACGRQKRMAYCQSNIGCSNSGNTLDQYADALSASVQNREMSDAEARRRFVEFKANMQANAQRNAAIIAAGEAAAGPSTCIRTGNAVNCY